ncbi:MAG: RluA family pseudouridine synthase [Planctomycetes bacterium]|nr:RluA family pseudouridine synthase [Planctomycetota bacterium]
MYLDDTQYALDVEVLPGESGARLDAFLAGRIADVSRAYVRKLIDKGFVTSSSRKISPATRVVEGDLYHVVFPEPEPSDIVPEPLPLDVLYEDSDIVVVNKAPGMIVHPAPGQVTGTLVGALLYRFGGLSGVQGDTRPGIVHRLDKDTSGVMVVARNDDAHRRLAAQFKDRTVTKVYIAVCHGVPRNRKGEVGRPIGRNLHQVGKMAVDGLDAKPAHTLYEVLDTVGGFSVIRCRILTGRTHQIRLHLAHIGCPVACDALYGREDIIMPADVGSSSGASCPLLARQALHSHRLTIRHPSGNMEMTFESPLPGDIAGFLDCLGKAQP